MADERILTSGASAALEYEVNRASLLDVSYDYLKPIARPTKLISTKSIPRDESLVMTVLNASAAGTIIVGLPPHSCTPKHRSVRCRFVKAHSSRLPLTSD